MFQDCSLMRKDRQSSDALTGFPVVSSLLPQMVLGQMSETREAGLFGVLKHLIGVSTLETQ